MTPQADAKPAGGDQSCQPGFVTHSVEVPHLQDIEFRLRAGTVIETFHDHALLFCEQSQQLHHLNASSAVLAFRLATGATIKDLVKELAGRGIGPSAVSWVHAFMAQMGQLGLLAAAWKGDAAPEATQQIALAGVNLSLHYSPRELIRSIGSSYVHLQSDGADMGCNYHLTAAGEFVLIAKGSAPPLVVEQSMAAVWLKGMILEEVMSAADHHAALHASCLTRGGRALLLLGSPGTGKTILSLALMRLGFRYGSDDVTLVLRNGTLAGIPLAPAVKNGGWTMIEALGHNLTSLPAHVRPDGQEVRFVQLEPEDLADPCQVGAVVKLHRASDQQATIEPISPTQGLAELLREARSPVGKCSTECMRALANIVRSARCVELRYTEANEAVPLLCALAQGA